MVLGVASLGICFKRCCGWLVLCLFGGSQVNSQIGFFRAVTSIGSYPLHQGEGGQVNKKQQGAVDGEDISSWISHQEIHGSDLQVCMEDLLNLLQFHT